MSALSLNWAPFLPWAALGVLAGLAVLLVLIGAFRSAPGWGLRGLLLALLLAILANPSLIEEERRALSDMVVLVVDESQSQNIPPRGEQTATVVPHLIEQIETLPDTDLRVVRGGRSQDSLTPNGTTLAEDKGTALFETIKRAMADLPRQRIAGLIVVSDGQIHDVPENYSDLGIGGPLHLLLTGEAGEGDRVLAVTKAPTFGIVGKPQSLTVLAQDLAPENAAAPSGIGIAQLTLRQDGEVIREIEIALGQEQEVEFELDRRGPSVLELEVSEGPQELSLINNRAAVVVNGVRERLRVLLVSGEPHAGERAWRNILKSDPAVDLVHFTILRPPEKQDGTPIRELSLIAFPTRELFEVKLDEFDLVIFDRYRRRGVLPTIYLDNIAQYVEDGGAFLEAVGPTFATPLSLFRSPLGRVMPGEPSGEIFEEGFQPIVTELGGRHPVTADLTGRNRGDSGPTWGRWFRQVDGHGRSGTVVMSGVQERPLIILDRVGEGRVAQIMSDHMWLWSRGFEGGGPQAELLRRIAHWLMKEPDLEEEELIARVEDGQLKIERRSLSGEASEVRITTPSGQIVPLALPARDDGRATGALPAEEFGLYRVEDDARTALAVAGPPNPLEYRDLRSSATKLRPLAQASRGSIYPLADRTLPSVRKVRADRDSSGPNWIGIAAQEAYEVAGAKSVPLLPALLVLALLLALTLSTWYREGK
ncbi:MAG: hypothetical protein AAF530_04090 [Pseudomonadota bacterium]